MERFCRVSGKVSYRLRTDARRALNMLRCRFPHYHADCYPCAGCRGWHFGRRRAGFEERKHV